MDLGRAGIPEATWVPAAKGEIEEEGLRVPRPYLHKERAKMDILFQLYEREGHGFSRAERNEKKL